MNPSPTRIIWIYSKYYKQYHETLGQLVSGIEFSPTFDYEAIMSKIEIESVDQHFLLVLDDILQLGENLDLIFTRVIPH